MKDQKVTSIVHHHIKDNHMEQFYRWYKKVTDESQKFEGFIDGQLLDSFGTDQEVISLFRFQNSAFLSRWLDSSIHNELLNELDLISEKETKINSYSGLEFWFERDPQSRLKMSVLTYIGLLPLVLVIPPLFNRLTGLTGTTATSLSTAISVLLMSYLVMPIINRLNNFICSKWSLSRAKNQG